MKLPPAYKLFSTNTRLLHLFILIITGLIVYSNTFNVPFLFDDIQNIVENRLIRDLRQFSEPSLLLNNRFFGLLTFALNYWLNDLNTTGYHVVNLAIHIANSLLVYRLIVSVFETPYFFPRYSSDSNRKLIGALALASSVLFLCHPVQTGAVTYIVQRFTLLATLFYLISLVMYLAARCHLSTHGQWNSLRFLGFYSISLLCAMFAMKCKEIAFTLPIMILITEFLFFDSSSKARIYLLLPFIATMAIIPLSMMLTGAPSGDLFHQADVVTQTTKSISRIDYLLTQSRVLITYVRLLLLPVGQNIDYDYPVFHNFLQIPVMVSFVFHIINIALAIILLRISRRDNQLLRVVSFGILWFYVTLSVESSIIPLDDVIFEHRMYLPSVGFILIPATCFIIFKKKICNGHAGASRMLVIIAALILAAAAFKRNAVWQSGVSIWQDAVHKSPLKSKPHYNLGFYLASSGELDAAIKEFQMAIKLDPNNGKARNNLGANLLKIGDTGAAIQEFRAAVLIDPYNAQAHFNLGYALAAIGDPHAAILELQEGLRIYPNDAAAQNQLRLLIDRAE